MSAAMSEQDYSWLTSVVAEIQDEVASALAKPSYFDEIHERRHRIHQIDHGSTDSRGMLSRPHGKTRQLRVRITVVSHHGVKCVAYLRVGRVDVLVDPAQQIADLVQRLWQIAVHVLAPSSLAGRRSVGGSSARGSASSAEDNRPGGAS